MTQPLNVFGGQIKSVAYLFVVPVAEASLFQILFLEKAGRGSRSLNAGRISLLV